MRLSLAVKRVLAGPVNVRRSHVEYA